MQQPINTADLVDIRDVSVDTSLPKQARIMEYIRQIRDPYHFRCGTFDITAEYTPDGPALEDCLRNLMT